MYVIEKIFMLYNPMVSIYLVFRCMGKILSDQIKTKKYEKLEITDFQERISRKLYKISKNVGRTYSFRDISKEPKPKNKTFILPPSTRLKG